MTSPDNIPLVDLRAQYRELGPEVEPVVRDIMADGRFILGPEVEGFERAFAGFCGVGHAVGVSSGTDAIHLALEALGVGPGDEVIVPANTFIATALAVSMAGARPVFADVDPDTFNCTAETVTRALTPKTRTILPVHLYGQTVDMDPLGELARSRGLCVVEDACQAHGAGYRGKRAGGLGVAGCFSFYPGKNLGAYGDGGMVVTGDASLAQKIRMLRDMGRLEKYEHLIKGYNSRLDNIQAAVLLVKLKRLDRWNEARRGWARLYGELLAGTPCVCPREAPFAAHVYHLYVIRTGERDRLAAHLRGRDIATGIHYPVPLHLQKAYAELGHRKGDFPVAERLAGEILSLPMYPELGEERVRRVCSEIRSFYGVR
ncbi:MAG: DegT/DnrJ/EryC1/StrS family aminotransferase [Candidatus Aureabacteria bacterium]|nr:DegT/DnrJ/EryC1/StrS family aminotransferase [Candidatus Auribacterota bacterium]